MYCPKCKQRFDEGSRRFCPTEGARLVSETAVTAAGRSPRGIFANLIPKAPIKRDLDEPIPDIPQVVIHEPEPGEGLSEADDDIGTDFFEFEDIEPDNIFDPVIGEPDTVISVETIPTVRKIKHYEIAAGHVELGGGDQLALSSADFHPNDPESFVGRTVKGRYCVTQFLGGEEGSYAFLADDTIIPKKKVLVRILPSEEVNEMAGGNFDDELVILSHISHPNIARLIDSGQFKDGTRFLISEYVDALSVNDLLSANTVIGALRTARIIRQVAYALNEVHQEGIIHRNLRPENIIVGPGDGENEQITLVNFGASNGEPNEHNIGYKAPEVFDGRVSTVPSDLFSLAVIAYEMLTGAMPFEAPTSSAFVKSQYAGLGNLPRKIRPELPAAIDSVLEKALSFDIADRYIKARDFGDAFYSALTDDGTATKPKAPIRKLRETPVPAIASKTGPASGLSTSNPKTAIRLSNGSARNDRLPESPAAVNSRSKVIAGVGILVLLTLLVFGGYYLVEHYSNPEVPIAAVDQNVGQTESGQPAALDSQMPPQPRNVPQPPNRNFYRNNKQDLKGDLLRNFVGFTLYYPNDWKVNDPNQRAGGNRRGKFLDISRLTPDGRLKEQMLVSYYPSKGTFNDDADKFPQMVMETNDTLKKLLPDYKMVSEGEVTINGGWRAYEIKFQGGGTSDTGDYLTVWGRRLFIPAARSGVRDGFEITMLATSLADDEKDANDVGVRGELAAVLNSFEPSPDF